MGAIEPDRAAELAASQNIKVYCVGAGTNGWAPVPQQNPFTGRMGWGRMRVEIDEDTLRDIAEKTGGRYFRATDREGLAQVYRAIDNLERTKITEFRYLQSTEHYPSFVIAAMGLIAAAVVSGGTVFRRIP